jgi:hypothetical protein
MLPKHGQSLAPVVGGNDLDIVVAEQLGYPQEFRRIVLDDKQALSLIASIVG